VAAEERTTTSIGSSISKGEEIILLWNRSEMQYSAFIAILEPQNICLSPLLFLLPSGSERGHCSCFHFFSVSVVLDINASALCFA